MFRRTSSQRVFPRGKFDTITTTDAPLDASASPSPVSVLTRNWEMRQLLRARPRTW